MSQDADQLPPLGGLDTEFATFLLSLGSSAMFHLGEPIGEEATPIGEPNLPVAKQTIDILCMLREKTRGNLSAGEDQLLESLLYDLRMRYIRIHRGAGG